MGNISFIAVAGSQSPAVFAITFVILWIVYAIRPVDKGVVSPCSK